MLLRLCEAWPLVLTVCTCLVGSAKRVCKGHCSYLFALRAFCPCLLGSAKVCMGDDAECC